MGRFGGGGGAAVPAAPEPHRHPYEPVKDLQPTIWGGGRGETVESLGDIFTGKDTIWGLMDHALPIWPYHFSYLPAEQQPKHYKSPQELASTKNNIKADIEFCTSWETELLNRPRTNLNFNSAGQTDIRVRAQEKFIAMVEERWTDSMDEGAKLKVLLDALEEMQVQWKDEENYHNVVFDVGESNIMYILQKSLKEKLKWCDLRGLSVSDQLAVQDQLNQWMPEQYRKYQDVDPQTVAALKPERRQEMEAAVNKIASEFLAKHQGSAFLSHYVEEQKNDWLAGVNPTNDITAATISAQSDVNVLCDWLRRVHRYNGDERMFLILNRAADLTKDTALKSWVSSLEKDLAGTMSLGDAFPDEVPQADLDSHGDYLPGGVSLPTWTAGV